MTVPREMIKHQSALVDTCWEEDAYAAAITMLDHLRATGTKPPIDHVRILLFLALHPPAQDKKKRAPAKERSGTKGKKRKAPVGRGKDDDALQAPTASECGAALDLLVAYTMTLHPMYILRALPAHVHYDGWVDDGDDEDRFDSVVGKRSLILARKKDCEDCWAMLRQEFIPDPATKQTRNAKPTSNEHEHEDSAHHYAPVGPHAWLVLAWLARVFEDDMQIWQADPTAGIGVPLFLSQIPQQRLSGSRNAPLWDTRAPVNVALYCFEADAEGAVPLSPHERMDVGARLLRIMVELSTPKKSHPAPLLEPGILLRNVLRKLPGLQPVAFDTLFRILVPDVPHFAIALLSMYLAATAELNPTTLFAADAPPYQRPRIDVVCALLGAPLPKQRQFAPADFQRHVHAKGYLMSAIVRSLLIAPAQDDAVWRNATHNNVLQKAVAKAFGPDMLGPPGGPVVEETARCAASWKEQVVLLLDCLAPPPTGA